MQVRVDQCRAFELPKAEGVVVELPSIIKVETILRFTFVNFLDRFRGENRKNYNFYFQESDSPQNYHTLFIEPQKDFERESNKLYFTSIIKADNSKNLKEIEIVADTVGKFRRSALGISAELISAKITLGFTNLNRQNYLSFVRCTIVQKFGSKHFNQIESFTTEAILLTAKPGMETIPRKDRFNKNSLYKAGTRFTSQFWQNINIPLLTSEETKLLQELESKGIPVKGK
jgi:hypothetical protein